ncbi:hypothetical protein FACS1894133_3730 [Clostridia bacterium]|nr:hypothetical protein FACS1894133_3730 [Clostridia bacterium]
MKKAGKFRFVTGFIAGALIFGAMSAYAAATVTATLSAEKIYVNGKNKAVESYIINNAQYVKLSDMSKALDIYISHDVKNQRYIIDTSKKSTLTATPAAAGYGTVFDMYKTGDIIKTAANPDIPGTVGGDYLVKKGALDNPWKTADGKVFPNQPLPQWQSEWNSYPKVTIPDVLTSHFKGTVHNSAYDTVMVTNRYEIERMIRTIYKYAKENPSLWKDKNPATNIPNFTIKVVMDDDMAVNTFYPWRDWGVESFVKHTGSGKQFRIYAYDTYNNGSFIDTEYFIK